MGGDIDTALKIMLAKYVLIFGFFQKLGNRVLTSKSNDEMVAGSGKAYAGHQFENRGLSFLEKSYHFL